VGAWSVTVDRCKEIEQRLQDGWGLREIARAANRRRVLISFLHSGRFCSMLCDAARCAIAVRVHHPCSRARWVAR